MAETIMRQGIRIKNGAIHNFPTSTTWQNNLSEYISMSNSEKQTPESRLHRLNAMIYFSADKSRYPEDSETSEKVLSLILMWRPSFALLTCEFEWLIVKCSRCKSFALSTASLWSWSFVYILKIRRDRNVKISFSFRLLIRFKTAVESLEIFHLCLQMDW